MQPANDLIPFLTEALHTAFDLPPAGPVVEVEGASPDALARLRIDLSGARLKADYRPSDVESDPQQIVQVAQLEILGQPVYYGASSFHVELFAQEAHIGLVRDALGRPILLPLDAVRGRFYGRISDADLEDLLLWVLRTVARDHGITVEQTELTLVPEGNRALGIDLRVTVSKKVVMRVRATIHGLGRISIDEDLNATISNLSCRGEGVVGVMVAGVVQSRLKHWEGRRLPLSTLGLVGKIRLHDLQVRCHDGLEIEAQVGR